MRSHILHIALVVSIALSTGGCEQLKTKRQVDTVAEVNGKYLPESDLQPMVAGLSPDDSARVADAYIRQWATEILVYDAARDKQDKQIEALVEDYRRSLYVHAYEQQLVNQRMSKYVAPAVIQDYYETHPQLFVLRESIMRGLLLVVPKDAPKLDKLRKHLQALEVSDMEQIEKYAYQYASGYEYFPDEWRTANQMLVTMPFAKNDLQEQLKHKTQIELQDSVSLFILRITDKCMAGEPAPMDYARAEIEQIILQQRQVEFLDNEREKLYEKWNEQRNE